MSPIATFACSQRHEMLSWIVIDVRECPQQLWVASPRGYLWDGARLSRLLDRTRSARQNTALKRECAASWTPEAARLGAGLSHRLSPFSFRDTTSPKEG